MENWNEWYEERLRDNYDEFEGQTVSIETYLEELHENEDLREKVSNLEEDLEDANDRIKELMRLLKDMNDELNKLDKLKNKQ